MGITIINVLSMLNRRCIIFTAELLSWIAEANVTVESEQDLDIKQ
jgi:hypothetical protein